MAPNAGVATGETTEGLLLLMALVSEDEVRAPALLHELRRPVVLARDDLAMTLERARREREVKVEDEVGGSLLANWRAWRWAHGLAPRDGDGHSGRHVCLWVGDVLH